MHPQRDILVLNRLRNDDHELAEEMDLLNNILHDIETIQHFCEAHEIIDMNKYKIFRQPHIIQKYIKLYNKAFVFVNNMN